MRSFWHDVNFLAKPPFGVTLDNATAEESTGPAISGHLVRSPLMHKLHEPGIELGPLVEDEILKYLKLQEVGYQVVLTHLWVGLLILPFSALC